MAKFAVISFDGWNGDIFNTYEDALNEAKEQSESTPDTEFFVVQLNARVISELKTCIFTDEKELQPNEPNE
jgi:hypothetical protein